MLETKKDNDFGFLFSQVKDCCKEAIDKFDIRYIPEIAIFLEQRLKEINTEIKPNIILGSDDLLKIYKSYLISKGLSARTINDYQTEAKRFLNYLEANRINFLKLNLTLIENYLSIAKRIRNLERGYSKTVVLVKIFIDFLNVKGYTNIKTSNIKIPKKVLPVSEKLSDKDIEKIEKYLFSKKQRYRSENLRDRLIFYLGIDCGLRKSEMTNLNIEDIDLENMEMKIKNSKCGKDRKVPISYKLKNIIVLYKKETKNYSGALVRGSFGERISKNSLQNIIIRTYEESGVYRKGLCIHSLRHTYADRQRRKGIDIPTISKLMGHTDIATTMLYFHITDDDIRKAVID